MDKTATTEITTKKMVIMVVENEVKCWTGSSGRSLAMAWESKAREFGEAKSEASSKSPPHSFIHFPFPPCLFLLTFSLSFPSLFLIRQRSERREAEEEAMAVRFLALIALCFLPALVTARPVKPDFIVEGKVYCDTCLAGFETTASTYISGAKVRVECRDVNSNKITYSCDGETNESGMYKIPITGDHEEQTCDMVLVSSPQSDCAKAVAGRDRARLALTHNNGIVSDKRYANNLSYQRHAPLAGCAQVMKQYQEYED